MNPDIKRKIQLKQPDGTFINYEFRQLKKGDEFIAFDPDGTPCEDGILFKALGDAIPPAPRSLDSTQLQEGEEDAWGIQVDDIVDGTMF